MSRSSAAADSRWLASALAEVEAGLRQRLDAARQQGSGAPSLGRPAEVASRMLEAVPFTAPSPWSALGPFYSSSGVARILGGVTRQAVEDRRRRRRIVAVRTTDGAWLYPSFQFDGKGRPIPGVAEAFAVLAPAYGDWSAASALVASQPELDGRSIVDHLAGGGAVAPLLDLCRRWVARWQA